MKQCASQYEHMPNLMRTKYAWNRIRFFQRKHNQPERIRESPKHNVINYASTAVQVYSMHENARRPAHEEVNPVEYGLSGAGPSSCRIITRSIHLINTNISFGWSESISQISYLKNCFKLGKRELIVQAVNEISKSLQQLLNYQKISQIFTICLNDYFVQLYNIDLNNNIRTLQTTLLLNDNFII
ncbi:Hypothetical_protein [Hexamita inflata]|uniref:Hypothetical_protein n=1 Tax=Hexamita inflata TaxID=28002 RepID=A0AA86QQ58_9EUKA|nr:Hypothetical protein HINF_LOCUS45698 [Hexamita inflata]